MGCHEIGAAQRQRTRGVLGSQGLLVSARARTRDRTGSSEMWCQNLCSPHSSQPHSRCLNCTSTICQAHTAHDLLNLYTPFPSTFHGGLDTPAPSTEPPCRKAFRSATYPFFVFLFSFGIDGGVGPKSVGNGLYSFLDGGSRMRAMMETK